MNEGTASQLKFSKLNQLFMGVLPGEATALGHAAPVLSYMVATSSLRL